MWISGSNPLWARVSGKKQPHTHAHIVIFKGLIINHLRVGGLCAGFDSTKKGQKNTCNTLNINHLHVNLRMWINNLPSYNGKSYIANK